MVKARSCTYEHADGRACGAPPLRAGSRCYWHEPEKRDELTEARRLGGLRRRKERTVAAAYDVGSLRSPAAIQRVLEILLVDALSRDNTPARGRLLNALANTALKLQEAVRFEVDDERTGSP